MHPLKSIVRCLCVLLIGASTASAGIMHPIDVTPSQAYLDFGAQSRFSSVAGLFGHTAAGGLDWLGSATVIDQNWVMASAHQVSARGYDYYSIRTGTSLYSNLADAIFYSSSFAVTDPSYGGIGAGRDISLIRFDTPITGLMPAQLYTGTVNLGDVINIAGFGGTAVVGEPIFYDYSKRGFQNVISNFGLGSFTDNFVGYSFVDANNPNFMPLGGLLWGGDSGGGWFIDDGGEFKLAGISAISVLTNSYLTKSFASTFDLAWVNSYVGSSAAVPEPGSLALLSAGFGIFALKRWRQRKMQSIIAARNTAFRSRSGIAGQASTNASNSGN